MGFDPQIQPWETKRDTKEHGCACEDGAFVWTPLMVSGRSDGKTEGGDRATPAGTGRGKVAHCAKQGARTIKREAA